MSAENRRTDSIRVRLSEDMMSRFEALAARYGMPPATLGAFAIAKFVTSEENSLNLSREALSKFADTNFSEDAMNDAISSALDAFMKSGVFTPEDFAKAKASTRS